MSERKQEVISTIERALEKTGEREMERLMGFCEGVAFMTGTVPQGQAAQV